MKRPAKILLGILALFISFILMIGGYVWLQGKSILESQMRQELDARGLDKLHFTIGHVGTQGITFKDISFGPGLTLDSITVGYKLFDLIKGNFNRIESGQLSFQQGDIRADLDAVTILFKPGNTRDRMEGEWNIKTITVNGAPVTLPTFAAAGTFSWINGAGSAEGKLTSADGNYLSNFIASYAKSEQEQALVAKAQGDWTIAALPIEEPPIPLPPLSSTGTFNWQGQSGSAKGTIKSADNSHNAAFTVNYPQAVATVTSITLPWNEGKLQSRDIKIPLQGNDPILVNLQLIGVSLNSLMQQATSNRATATGAVSGTVPVLISRDGSFTLKPGTLDTGQGGTIALQPEIIPGDHPQVETVRTLLGDFHYTNLSLKVNNTEDKKLSMLLSLQGNNPNVYDGRQVNLNVNLTGDVLEMIQQSLLTMNPEKLLQKQGTHEKR